LCDEFGISRQAWHKQLQSKRKEVFEEEIIVQVVKEIRAEQPRVGTRKLLIHLQDMLQRNQIKLGRDAFFDLLNKHNLLIRKRVRKPKTTNSNHHYRKYPNLIKHFNPLKANELWVSDITYVDTREGFVYLFLITDAYSHKIVGHAVGNTLEARWAVQALQMALSQRDSTDTDLIHHSDRGVQYCCYNYTDLLNAQPNTRISMTESGDPRENPVAERINGILKGELLVEELVTKLQAKAAIATAIQTYNNIRLHSSIDHLTPQQAHLKTGPIQNRWKPKHNPSSKPNPLQTA
jgi:putative transposase